MLWRLLQLGPERLSPEALGLGVAEPVLRARFGGVCEAFREGFNRALCTSRLADLAWLAGGPPYFRPFAYEGYACGFVVRRLTLRSVFEPPERVAWLVPDLAYLGYVGLGFGRALLRPRSPRCLVPWLARFDPLLAPLMVDGFGFKLGLVDGLAAARLARRASGLPPGLRPALLAGFGRSLWFRAPYDVAALERLLLPLDDPGADAWSGVGLAAGFLGVGEMDRVLAFGSGLGCARRSAFEQGVAFAMEARGRADAEHFADALAGAGATTRAWAQAALDAVREARRRVEAGPGGTGGPYQHWRELARRVLGEVRGRQPTKEALA